MSTYNDNMSKFEIKNEFQIFFMNNIDLFKNSLFSLHERLFYFGLTPSAYDI
jgi:hypothetical protein